jgi:XTP/dITP diphosphohydrolase
MQRLVIASANAGKVREIEQLLRGLPYQPVSQASLGVRSPEETEDTFLGNALIKARHAAAATGLAALADDSGIEVDALGGAPGVHSARFAGADASDADNNAKLVAALAGVEGAARSARYRCVLVLVEHASDSSPLVAQASWEGLILDSPRGTGGFGYDPYFWVPELGLSAAQLTSEQKNAVSHRGRALAQLRTVLLERAQPEGV